MTATNPEDFNRAIDQIRDGKLDSMLSQMFGSEPSGEDEQPTEARGPEPGKNGRHRPVAAVALLTLAGASLVVWGATLGQRHAEIQETEVRLIAGEDQLASGLEAFALEQERLAFHWEQQAKDQRNYAQKLETQELEIRDLIAKWLPRIAALIQAKDTFEAGVILGAMSDIITNSNLNDDAELVHSYAKQIRALIDELQQDE